MKKIVLILSLIISLCPTSVIGQSSVMAQTDLSQQHNERQYDELQYNELQYNELPYDVEKSLLLIMESKSFYSRILGQDVHFSVCLPPNYYTDTLTSYPVNYLLHGLGDDETGWLEYGSIWSLSVRAISEGDAIPMIYVMPEAFRSYYVNDYAGTFMYEDMFVKELVPVVDSLLRTKKEAQQRALTGYSMGGFGAMMLHLKHPDIFGTTVPLSMSVRTDEQYMTEDASGWDEQWGRLFGKPGLKGKDRLTDYYKANSPFHLITTLTTAQKQSLNIYMLNGDDEETLCRSNEELHILMNSIALPHEYRVVNGGHSFRVWRNAMTNGLRFISDSFEGKPYRGDKKTTNQVIDTPEKYTLFKTSDITGSEIPGVQSVYVPEEYTISNRNYPVIFISGKLDSLQQDVIARMIYLHPSVIDNCPLLLAFISADQSIAVINDKLKQKLRIRSGNKYRSLISLGGDGYKALRQTTEKFPINTIVLSDNSLSRESARSIFSEESTGLSGKVRIFIDYPAKGSLAEGNGALHMLLRDRAHSHEYRVREGNGGFEWMCGGLEESLEYIIVNFHR